MTVRDCAQSSFSKGALCTALGVAIPKRNLFALSSCTRASDVSLAVTVCRIAPNRRFPYVKDDSMWIARNVLRAGAVYRCVPVERSPFSEIMSSEEILAVVMKDADYIARQAAV